jgi:hypothetical protein
MIQRGSLVTQPDPNPSPTSQPTGVDPRIVVDDEISDVLQRSKDQPNGTTSR